MQPAPFRAVGVRVTQLLVGLFGSTQMAVSGVRVPERSHDVIERPVRVRLFERRAGRPGEETEAGPGETATWVSDVPHTYAALGPAPVESVLVIRSPAG